MLPVKCRVEGIIKIHAGDVQKGRSDADQCEAIHRSLPAKNPSGQAIGPNGGQIGDAAEDQHRPQVSREGESPWRHAPPVDQPER